MNIKKKKKDNGFYSLDNILEYGADYNIIIGERSNGKTYSVLERVLLRYLSTGEQSGLIRRWEDDFKKGRAQSLFSPHINNNILEDTEWTGIDFKVNGWYLYKWDDDLKKKIYDEEPFMFAFALTMNEHYKSTSYPNITTVIFDEMLTRNGYLPDEFILFSNILSTIIRHRDNVTIFMLGNTVNKDCPYFKEMGLKHVKDMVQGTIDVYSYGKSELKVAVEYCDNLSKEIKKSDKYFAFDNPALDMITNGSWETAIYPHLPLKYAPKDIIKSVFIMWEDDILQGDIVKKNNSRFLFIHRKTTPIKDENKDIIYSPTPDPRKNWHRRITNPTDKLTTVVYQFFKEDKVYYQDNELGEIMRNYLQFCNSFSIIR